MYSVEGVHVCFSEVFLRTVFLNDHSVYQTRAVISICSS